MSYPDAKTIEQYKEFIERMTGVKVVKVKKQPKGTIDLKHLRIDKRY